MDSSSSAWESVRRIHCERHCLYCQLTSEVLKRRLANLSGCGNAGNIVGAGTMFCLPPCAMQPRHACRILSLCIKRPIRLLC